MNPIVLYPKNAEQSKFFKETAESKGVEIVFLSEEILKYLDEMEDLCFAETLVERSKTAKNISREKMMALFENKLK